MAPPYKIDCSRLFGVLDIINETSIDQLRDVDFVENLICQVGLHSDSNVSPNYGEKNQQFLVPSGMLQQPRQLAEALIFLSDKDIKSYVEIGTFNGICTGFIVGYLNRFVKRLDAVTIDITERYHPDYKAEMEDRFDILFLTEDSKKIKGYINDLCFIDGDHNYYGVKADYENIGRHAKYCMFHDIAEDWQLNLNDGGSHKHWNEVKLDHKHYEFLHTDIDRPSFGIGIIKHK